MHPILDALDNTQYDWIKKLLFTFNEGNIGKFEALAPLFPQEVRACCCGDSRRVEPTI
jgi:26S proteasome regulatory subunit N9